MASLWLTFGSLDKGPLTRLEARRAASWWRVCLELPAGSKEYRGRAGYASGRQIGPGRPRKAGAAKK